MNRDPSPTLALLRLLLLEITILLLATLTIILCEAVTIAIAMRRSTPAIKALKLSLHPRNSFSLLSFVHALSWSSGLSSWFLSRGDVCGFPGLLDRSNH